jgi:hypothetical protein
MDAIHFANESHWRSGEAATFEERTAYSKRLERLEKIRKELDQLRSLLRG